MPHREWDPLLAQLLSASDFACRQRAVERLFATHIDAAVQAGAVSMLGTSSRLLDDATSHARLRICRCLLALNHHAPARRIASIVQFARRCGVNAAIDGLTFADPRWTACKAQILDAIRSNPCLATWLDVAGHGVCGAAGLAPPPGDAACQPPISASLSDALRDPVAYFARHDYGITDLNASVPWLVTAVGPVLVNDLVRLYTNARRPDGIQTDQLDAVPWPGPDPPSATLGTVLADATAMELRHLPPVLAAAAALGGHSPLCWLLVVETGVMEWRELSELCRMPESRVKTISRSRAVDDELAEYFNVSEKQLVVARARALQAIRNGLILRGWER
ncbi:MAG: hypothetical protein KGJ62_13865 [Armatimonadetes bacterium]|nr:hypothetical protein [Armatimonadota bacterium]MDE2206371.1 hypothetical protein [Armatimonadota bacterium]